MLAEAGRELGGRVARECRLPGLAAWGRVRDYRAQQIARMTNVEVFFESRVTADDVLGLGVDHVGLATGSIWRRDGVARYNTRGLLMDPAMPVFTPDDLMAGARPDGHIVLYDDDHYYMGGVLAELLIASGCRVTLVTPAARVSDWTFNTLEQGFIQSRLIGLGVDVRATRGLAAVADRAVEIACTYSGRREEVACDALVLVTARLPEDGLLSALRARRAESGGAGIRSVKAFGDCLAPAPIAWATYAGHRYARELDGPDIGDAVPFRRELPALAPLGN
jgi:dimethylamine/trimethylamine dehydrogenase